MKAVIFALACLPLPGLAQNLAQSLVLPEGAQAGPEIAAPGTSHSLVTGPWSDGTTAHEVVTGLRTDQVFRLTPAQSTDVLTESLKAQLDGFDLLFDCRDTVCGGFDFRFDLSLLPEPGMHVDLGDFRYVAALSADKTRSIAFVVSKSATANYVQVMRVAPGVAAEVPETPGGPDVVVIPDLPEVPELPDTPATVLPDAGVTRLVSDGHMVLEDLTFATGSSELGPGEFESLTALAAWLKANPETRVAIVGHTDAVGALENNIALSRRRAASVADRLVSGFGIPAAQIEAQGAGWLAPRATNSSEDGRQKNRRVEVIVISVP